MAFDGGGGFKSTNRAPAMAHKRSMERKSMAGGAGPTGGGMSQQSDPLSQPTQDGDGGEHTPEEAQQIVQEHGPAMETHTTHMDGMHTMTSKHPDGHEHHSEHGSADEAHEHAKHLSEDGGGMEHEPDGDEAPQYE
jgi:hypothetical protein